MPSLKHIRKRIGSVRNTQKITKAMKMIAAAKLRRAQDAILNTRPYARRIDGLIKGLTEGADEYMDPLMVPREQVKAVALLIVTSDKGLCGGFNANILRRADRAIREEWPDREVRLWLIGRKAIEYYRRRQANVAKTFPELYHHNLFEEADIVADGLVRGFRDGEVDEVWTLYNEFKSVITQKVTIEKLVPIAPSEEAQAVAHHEYKYEPDRHAILDELAPEHVSIQIYRCLLESQASEQSARMNAMDGATRNAGEMIDRLTLQYNRARQAAITKELMEIIGGAEALKG
ncbi:MAG: ATP synthase F1 subunit gamma [Myxococcales bacterium]|nr:MAG: ATP synthase F1 subunit gamma [Myxococcales bacterium]